MDSEELRELLDAVRSGTCSIEQATNRLRGYPSEDLGFAQPDHGRTARHGFPEVVFCQRKTVDHILAIADAIVARSHRVLLTRVEDGALTELGRRFPDGCNARH